jgi:transmembrane sensor
MMNDFELIVEEGYVKVTLRDLPGHSEIVGQWEMLTGTANRMEKYPVIDRTYLSWRMNRMQFRDEKLDNIAAVISKNYDVNIYFENDAIGDRRLNVTFHDNDINIIAEVIAFGLGLDYEIMPDSGIMFSIKTRLSRIT